MSKEAIKYYEKHRVIGDYLDKASVVSMMNGFHRQEQAKLLTIPVVVKSLPTVCKNYVNGQCTECDLNEHKECNG
tara:strand:+ start:9845 stop:10069 length:225 start_codon:yes stop_codon:yes gene_type:complete